MHTTDHLNTALAGRYEIEKRIGAGGMATVYLARDIKHHRNVALKVLSPELGAVLGPERFLAEIEVTANLHHPHLLPLFDSGEAIISNVAPSEARGGGLSTHGGSLLYYVMPYIEGETLRARLERERQLTVDDAIRIACAVASALDYAHRHGVIHRDLKPENILLHENDPLVMDFGIALAVSNAGGARITQTGLSLGTPQYMSPEQATGDRQIDGRSDIYSLAAVLYEMLTGEPPHTGSTVQAIIARVITDRPRTIRSSRDTVPDHVDAAVQQALAKLPADRFSSAAEFADALTGVRPVTLPANATHPGMLVPRRIGVIEAPGMPGRRSGGRYRERVAWTLLAAAVAALVVQLRKPAPATSYGQFQMTLPDSVSIFGPLAISHDGSRLVFVGVADGRRALYVRRADDPVAQLVRGTDEAQNATFSSNGDWLLFNVPGGNGRRGGATLSKVPVGGGTPQRVADSVANTASWGDDDHVLVVRPPGRLYLVTSDGASQRLVGRPDSAAGIRRYAWPEMLPGSAYALVAYERGAENVDSSRIGLITLANGALTDLGLAGTNPHYVKSGYVVFGRAGGFVFAAPFSLSKRKVTGPASLLLEGVWMGRGGATDVAVADNGTMMYHGGAPTRTRALVAVDSLGREQQVGKAQEEYGSPRVSPDERHIAVGIGPSVNRGDVWILDVATNALSRLTADSSSSRAEWTRDGKSLVFLRTRHDSAMIVQRSWDGSGRDSLLASHSAGDSTRVNDIALGPPQGYSVLRTGDTLPFSGNRNLHIALTAHLDVMRDFVVTPISEMSPRIAPNGATVAYESSETGRPQIYVRPLPGPGARVQISVDGGEEPVWSRDGQTIYYRAPNQTIVAAKVRLAPAFSIQSYRTLFADVYQLGQTHAGYDAMSNGRLLFVRGRRSDSKMMVVIDWPRLLKRPQSGDDRPE